MIYSFGQSDGLIPGTAPTQSYQTELERQNSPLQQFDPNSPDIEFANKQAQELINISGANVIVYARTNNADFDTVWEEDYSPTYMSGKNFKAYFAPKPLAAELTPWGIDVPNQTDVIFCRQDVYREFKERMIRIGDIILLPYNSVALKPDKFRVLNAFDSGNFRYSWLYLTCRVENITDDTTIDINHK